MHVHASLPQDEAQTDHLPPAHPPLHGLMRELQRHGRALVEAQCPPQHVTQVQHMRETGPVRERERHGPQAAGRIAAVVRLHPRRVGPPGRVVAVEGSVRWCFGAYSERTMHRHQSKTTHLSSLLGSNLPSLTSRGRSST
jgi:hypothetical protein